VVYFHGHWFLRAVLRCGIGECKSIGYGVRTMHCMDGFAEEWDSMMHTCVHSDCRAVLGACRCSGACLRNLFILIVLFKPPFFTTTAHNKHAASVEYFAKSTKVFVRALNFLVTPRRKSLVLNNHDTYHTSSQPHIYPTPPQFPSTKTLRGRPGHIPVLSMRTG
jgi:hypothetical protein